MMSPKTDLNKILPLLGLSSAGNREQVAIELSGNQLKLARAVVYSNRKELVEIAYRDIAGLSDEEISRALKGELVSVGAKNPEVIVAIPANLVITKNIEIPSTNPREIMAIVNLQAGRHTPYSREEIIVDYIDIGIYKQTYTRILLVIAARNIIKRQFLIVERAGVKCSGALFAPEGIAATLDRLLKLNSHEVPTVSLHIDESFTDFMVTFKDKPIFIRPIPIGAQHFVEEREMYQAKFADEVKGSLEAYESEGIGGAPHIVVLIGAVEVVAALDTTLAEMLHIPTHIAPYGRSTVFSDEMGKKIAAVRHLSLLNAIAPLIAVPAPKVSLVPEEIRLRRNVEERGRDLIKTGICILSLTVLMSAIFISKIYFKGAFLNNLRSQYKEINAQAKQLEDSFTRAMVAANYLSARGYSLEVLGDLYAIIPADLELADIRYDAQGKFSLGGTAGSMSTVFSFVDKMEKSKYFKDVKTKYTTKRKEAKRGDVVDFEIIAALEKGKS